MPTQPILRHEYLYTSLVLTIEIMFNADNNPGVHRNIEQGSQIESQLHVCKVWMPNQPIAYYLHSVAKISRVSLTKVASVYCHPILQLLELVIVGKLEKKDRVDDFNVAVSSCSTS